MANLLHFNKRLLSKILFAIMFFLSMRLYAAEQAETERLIRKITPPLAIIEEKIEKKDEWYVDCFYEPSDILQGNRTGHWNEITTSFGYIHRAIQSYVSVSQLDRFDSKDYTANFGSYISFKDSYAHIEAGFGWDIDYIYKFQSIAEYGHKLYDTLFGQIGYTYRGYDTDDTHLVFPGLIYYFGDSYMSANYGASFMEGHDTAHIGTMKGDFAITNFLRWSCGLAFGGRLYDINGFDAHAEYGYILFTGLSLNIYKGITFRAGYSYGTEDPKFIKRSLNFAVSAKF